MPDKGPPVDSSPDLFEIERTSREFHQLASMVGERLQAFTAWINALPGKTEVQVAREEVEPGHFALLSLERYKEGWTLLFGTGENGSSIHLPPLEQASLSDKCIAISMLPELLNALHEKQRYAVDRMTAAAKIFAQLPTTKGGK